MQFLVLSVSNIRQQTQNGVTPLANQDLRLKLSQVSASQECNLN